MKIQEARTQVRIARRLARVRSTSKGKTDVNLLRDKLKTGKLGFRGATTKQNTKDMLVTNLFRGGKNRRPGTGQDRLNSRDAEFLKKMRGSKASHAAEVAATGKISTRTKIRHALRTKRSSEIEKADIIKRRKRLLKGSSRSKTKTDADYLATSLFKESAIQEANYGAAMGSGTKSKKSRRNKRKKRMKG